MSWGVTQGQLVLAAGGGPSWDRAADHRLPRRRTATPAGARTPGRRGRRQAQHVECIAEHRAGRGHRPRRWFQRVQQPGEQHPHALGAAAEPAQPAPHSAHRPTQPDGDRAVPQTGCLRQQSRADHRHVVRPARQARRGQQHVRGTAPRTARPTRTTPHLLVGTAAAFAIGHDPRAAAHRRIPDSAAHHRSGADRPRAGPSLPSAPGASKHQATALPFRPRIREGRCASTTSSRSRRERKRATPRVTLQNIVNVNDANQAPHPRLRRRSTLRRVFVHSGARAAATGHCTGQEARPGPC